MQDRFRDIAGKSCQPGIEGGGGSLPATPRDANYDRQPMGADDRPPRKKDWRVVVESES